MEQKMKAGWSRSCRTMLTAILASMSLAGCESTLEPASGESEPFYFYDGSRISLRVDASRITAALEAGADTALLRTTLASQGVTTDSIRPLSLPRHWLVHIRRSDRSGPAMERTARVVRLTPGVEFASAAYLPLGAECPLLPVNQFLVQFRAGATAEQIDRLNASTGVQAGGNDASLLRTYRYPLRMGSTPLELAAYYHHQSIVEWASVDWIDTCRVQMAGG
jgi:hypothetical protein